MSVGPATCRWSLTRFGGQITGGAKVGLATELRYREKVMATTWSSRQDARIRYTAPAVADGRSAPVTEIVLYRNLYEAWGRSDPGHLLGSTCRPAVTTPAAIL